MEARLVGVAEPGTTGHCQHLSIRRLYFKAAIFFSKALQFVLRLWLITWLITTTNPNMFSELSISCHDSHFVWPAGKTTCNSRWGYIRLFPFYRVTRIPAPSIDYVYMSMSVTYSFLSLHPDSEEFHRSWPQISCSCIWQVTSYWVQNSPEQHTILRKTHTMTCTVTGLYGLNFIPQYFITLYHKH